MKVAIVTATRAEYGILRPVIEKLRDYESADVAVELIVTGTHLSEDHGMTVNEIEKDGIRIDHRIPIPVNSATALDISEDQAVTLTEFTKLFEIEKYSALYILGDRYEMLMIATAALNTGTPVFHLCGGDTTEGAIDEAIRHAITKFSYLHFVTNDESRHRVIQLGEAPDRVFNVGDPGIDNILSMDLLDPEDVLKELGVDQTAENGYVLCTYHPVTIGDDDIEKMMNEFLGVIKARPDLLFIITGANADKGGSKINEILTEAAGRSSNLYLFASLGSRRYLSLMSGAKFVLGNSSSGIYEAPSFHIPTVNIGDRQRGRLRADSIIDCSPDKESILEAIKKAESDEFARVCASVTSPFGDGHASEKIAKISMDVLHKGIDLKKRFYDMDRFRDK